MCRKLLVMVVAGVACVAATGAQEPAGAGRTQVRFVGPSGMQIRWLVVGRDGKARFSETPLEAPARYNFRQGAVYRLKLSHIAGFPGLEVYPTLEVPAAGPAAGQFLAHNAVALELTADDFRRVTAGKQIVKTVTLPGSGGVPLLVLRMGNLDMEAPGQKQP